MTDSLCDALTDLVVMVKRDGVILSHMGGRGVAALALPQQAVGQRLDAIWPESIAACVKQAVRRAIAQRATFDTPFTEADVRYELRTSAQGPDRALLPAHEFARRFLSHTRVAAAPFHSPGKPEATEEEEAVPLVYRRSL